MEISMKVPQKKLKNRIYDLAILVVEIYPKEGQHSRYLVIYEYCNTPQSTVNLESQPRCPLTDEWV